MCHSLAESKASELTKHATGKSIGSLFMIKLTVMDLVKGICSCSYKFQELLVGIVCRNWVVPISARKKNIITVQHFFLGLSEET